MGVSIESGETLHAAWAAQIAGEEAFGVFGEAELFVLASPGAAARASVAALGELETAHDVASRSALRSPPIDPLAAAIESARTRAAAHALGSMSVLRLTPPWASFAHVGGGGIGLLTGNAWRWSSATTTNDDAITLTYVPAVRGALFVLCTDRAPSDPSQLSDRARPLAERCRELETSTLLVELA